MTEEIREILEEISNDENYSNFIDSQNGGAEYYLLLEKIEGKQLVNYITNLQKENEILRENAEHNDKVVDKVKWNEMIYKSRNEKAVEYIKNRSFDEVSIGPFDNDFNCKENLLNILKGGDE